MCTRVFWSGNNVAKVASRTMDWQVSDDPVLWAVPGGHKADGRPGGLGVTIRRVGLSMWDSGTTDAMNSAGLAAHLLYLGSAGFAVPGSPGAIPNLLWAQWVLDHCATVGEAVTALHDLPIVSAPVRGQDLGCHLALEDSSGDSAIVEPFEWWTSAVDLTNLTYYFWSHTSPSLIWAELSGIDLSPGAPVRSLNPRQPGLVGDVTARLTPAALAY
jgi:penicillin V acylase-like amidase (Ntn superfamily)